jgi:hypothetical protein
VKRTVYGSSGSGSGGGIALAPTAVKTAAYTAAAGDLVVADTSASAFAVTLPSAPADKTAIAVKLIAAGNTLTINPGGSDVFNKAGGSTSLTLTLVNQGYLLTYKASSGIWYVLTDDLPLGQLDSRYASLRTSGPGGTFAANTGSAVTVGDPTDLAAGFGVWAGVLTANCTVTLPTVKTGAQFVMRLTQDATGARTVTFAGGSVSFPGAQLAVIPDANAPNWIAFVGGATSWLAFPLTSDVVDIIANALSVRGPAGLGASSFRFIGALATMPPSSGTFQARDIGVALDSNLWWICTVGGTPGTWAVMGGGGATSSSIGTATKILASSAAWAIPSDATLLEITAVGGGGGSASGGSPGGGSPTANQSGGTGGAAGMDVTRIVPVGSNTTLNVTIGAGGTAGAAPAAGTTGAGVAGNAGGNGGDTSVIGTGISVTGRGGAGGNAPSGNSSTVFNGPAWGSAPGTSTGGTVRAGDGGDGRGAAAAGGVAGGRGHSYTGGGGGGGGGSTATLGGGGGTGGDLTTFGAAGTQGGSGVANGVDGGAAPANSGGGAGGGGGGSWNGGASAQGHGGAGAAGGSGYVIVRVVG